MYLTFEPYIVSVSSTICIWHLNPPSLLFRTSPEESAEMHPTRRRRGRVWKNMANIMVNDNGQRVLIRTRTTLVLVRAALGGLQLGILRSHKLIILSLANPAQKNAQLDEAGHLALHDAVCLWIWLRPRLASEFPGDVCTRHEELFMKGYLD